MAQKIYKVTKEIYDILKSGESVKVLDKEYRWEEDALYTIVDYETPEYSLKQEDNAIYILENGVKKGDGIKPNHASHAGVAEQAEQAKTLYQDYGDGVTEIRDGYYNSTFGDKSIYISPEEERIYVENASNYALLTPSSLSFSGNNALEYGSQDITKGDYSYNFPNKTGTVAMTSDLDSKAGTAVATTSANGLMSKDDKTKLNGIALGAEVNVQSDWNVTNTSSDAFIKNKPTIPTVNNATLTIQKNGTTVDTFTANSATDKIINITVPTGTAANKGVDTSISEASTSTKLPTSAAVAAFVEGKGYKTTDNNTTYTIATGDSNGQIKVTPSSGSAYNVSVKGLGSAAYTASTAYATAHHLYHTWDNNTNYYDSYEGGNMFRIVTENMYADCFRFQASTVSNLEYYSGSSWVSWNFDLSNLFDGNARTGVSIPYANRKFRFQLTANGGWPTTALFMLQGTWFSDGGWPNGQKSSIVIETRASTSDAWSQKASFDLSGVEGMAGHTLSSLHTGHTLYRITIEIAPWTSTSNSCPLQRLCLFSNYNGGALEKITHDGNGNITIPTLKSTTIYENGTSLANKYLGKTAKAADADKLDGNDSAHYLNYNNLTNTPTIPTKSSWNYDDSYVKYSAAQSLTDAQKTQARSNIGAGTSNLTLGTTATTAAKGDHTHSVATTSANGLMSASDKTTLTALTCKSESKDIALGLTSLIGDQTVNPITANITDRSFFSKIIDLMRAGQVVTGFYLQLGNYYTFLKLFFANLEEGYENLSFEITDANDNSCVSYGINYDASNYIITFNKRDASIADALIDDNGTTYHYNSFALSSHNQASNTINAMTNYSKPTSTSAIKATDSLNTAIGKLEKALDGKGTSNLTLGTTATTAAKGDHTHSVATTSANGLMSKEDKTKLDTISNNYVKEYSTGKNSMPGTIINNGSSIYIDSGNDSINVIGEGDEHGVSISVGDNNFVNFYQDRTEMIDAPVKIKQIQAPTASNGSKYGLGTSGQVLKSNGTSVYWANDSTTSGSGDTYYMHRIALYSNSSPTYRLYITLYNKSSTKLTYSTLVAWLTGKGCTSQDKMYSCTGMAGAAGNFAMGVHANGNNIILNYNGSSGVSKYTMSQPYSFTDNVYAVN